MKSIPLIIIIFIIAFSLIILNPLVTHLTQIPMLPEFQQTDFLLTHLPIAKQINFSFSTYQQIPLWNVFQFSGQPFIADPLSGYWYLPNWLTFLFPFPITFNILFFLHITFGGIGVFQFLIKRKLTNFPSLFGAFCWMGTPKMIGYLAGGQVSTIFAFAWLPWLLIATEDLSKSFSRKNILLTAAILSTIIFADIRWGFFCGLFSSSYLIVNIKDKKEKSLELFKIILSLIGVVILMSSILTLPLLEFMSFSRRAELSIQDLNFLSIEPKSLFGLLAPQIGINYEQIIYMGILPLILSVLGIKKRNIFWLFSGVFCVLYSLGANTFFYPLIVKAIPFLTWLRVPSRAWFFFIFSVCILSSDGLQFLIEKQIDFKFKKTVYFCSFAVSFFAIFMSIGMHFVIGYIPDGMILMAFIIPISFLSIGIIVMNDQSKNLKKGFVILILIADLAIVNRTLLFSQPLSKPSQVVQWIENQPGFFRVFSPSYGFPMPNTLQQANGVNPMHLDAYANYIKHASNYSSGKYSVSLPDIYIDEKTPIEIIEQARYPNLEMLGQLNVKYIASSFALKSPGLFLEKIIDGHFIYKNSIFNERSWYEGGSVKITKWSPNEIILSTKGKSGNLILSEINYPGWKVWIDGTLSQINPASTIFRTVYLEGGNHEIIFRFLPVSFFVGCILSLLGWGTMIFTSVKKLLIQKKLSGANG